jgi:hypothetical protein
VASAWKNIRKREIAKLNLRWNALSSTRWPSHYKFSVSVDGQAPNYRDHAKILLVMPLDFDKSANHEVCSSDHSRFHCVRVASIRGVTTAFSGESGAAI